MKEYDLAREGKWIAMFSLNVADKRLLEKVGLGPIWIGLELGFQFIFIIIIIILLNHGFLVLSSTSIRGRIRFPFFF